MSGGEDIGPAIERNFYILTLWLEYDEISFISPLGGFETKVNVISCTFKSLKSPKISCNDIEAAPSAFSIPEERKREKRRRKREKERERERKEEEKERKREKERGRGEGIRKRREGGKKGKEEPLSLSFSLSSSLTCSSYNPIIRAILDLISGEIS